MFHLALRNNSVVCCAGGIPTGKDEVGHLYLSVAELLAGIEQPGKLSLAVWRLSLLLPRWSKRAGGLLPNAS